MSEKTYGNKEVIRKVNKKFAAVKIDVTNMNYHLNFEGKRYSAEEFLGMIGIQGTPTTLFLDQNGKFLTKIPGFVPPETYLSLLDYFYQSCYSQNMSFQDFMDKPGKCKKSSSK
jgi:thioredoxin-related protein